MSELPSAPRKLLVLGAGYAGLPLARHWARAGIDVRASTTSSHRLEEIRETGATPVLLDASDAEPLERALSGCDTVALLVAPSGGDYRSTYLETAKNLAAVLSRLPELRQVLWASSSSVYGDHQGAWVDGGSECRPEDDAAQILLESERTLREACHREGRLLTILRLGGIHGPGREMARIYSRSFGQVRPGRPDAPACWVHLDDIVGAFAFCAEKRLGGIHNVSSEPEDIGILLDRLAREAGAPPVRFDPSQPPRKRSNVRLDTTSLRKAGYIFRHPRLMD